MPANKIVDSKEAESFDRYVLSCDGCGENKVEGVAKDLNRMGWAWSYEEKNPEKGTTVVKSEVTCPRCNEDYYQVSGRPEEHLMRFASSLAD